jgi:D-3-phosphoglycerate dehydrogenase
MSVVAWSRSLTDEIACQLEVLRATTIEELVNQCDIVSLHVAYTPETEHLFSAELIARLKPGAVLLNTSRGPVVDTIALAEALKTELGS